MQPVCRVAPENLLFLLLDRSRLALKYRFPQFSGFAPLPGQIAGISLKGMDSRKNVLKLLDPPSYRISNSFGADSNSLGFGYGRSRNSSNTAPESLQNSEKQLSQNYFWKDCSLGVVKFSGVAPANQTKERAKRKVHEFRPFS